MSESYLEYLVKRKASPIKVAIKYLLYVWTGFLVLVGLLGNITSMVLGVICGAIAYFYTMNAEIEYEYLFLGRDLSVDKIHAKSKRKRMMEFDLERKELIAPVKSHRLDSYRANKKYISYDFSSHQEGEEAYCFIYAGDNEVSKVIIDMTDELLQCFKNVSPRKVFTD